MPSSGDSIKYKSVVITLLSIVVALVSFIGVGALQKLDRLELAVVTMQATRDVREKDNAQLSDTVRVLSAQVEFLTQWMTDTFGEPKPKNKAQFGRH